MTMGGVSKPSTSSPHSSLMERLRARGRGPCRARAARFVPNRKAPQRSPDRPAPRSCRRTRSCRRSAPDWSRSTSGADSPHEPPSSPGDPRLERRVPEIGVSLGQVLTALDEQGRDPVRIMRVDRPGKMQEFASFRRATHRYDLKISAGGGALCSVAWAIME